MRTSLFVLLFFSPLAVFSQSDFKPAFVVKNNGDTVKGFIEQGNEGQISSKVSFKTDVNQKSAEYFTTNDITSFGFTGGNIFKRITFNNTLTNKDDVSFGKFLLSGYYRLFVFLRNERTYYVIKSVNDSTYLLYDDVYNSSGTDAEKGNYKNILLFVATGCGDMKNAIERLSYSEKDLIGYVGSINKCMAPSQASIVLYKKPGTEFHVFGYAGGMYVGSGHEFTGRAIAHFTIPSVDKRTSLNIGINYMQRSQTKYVYIAYLGNYLGTKTKETVVTNIVSIPFSIEYHFTDGKVQPYFAAGVCYVFRQQSGELDMFRKPTSFSDNGPTYLLSAGIDYNASKNLIIKAEWRQELISHYPTVGVAYFFK